jgi:hypothetical protein
MSAIYAELSRNSKEESVSSEERAFIDNFIGDFEIGPPLITRLPKWLWAGAIPTKKHPHLKLKLNMDKISSGSPQTPAFSSLNSALSNSAFETGSSNNSASPALYTQESTNRYFFT